MTADFFSSTDLRRAGALLLHTAVADVDGVRAIWDEAAEDDSWPDLAGALIAVVFDLAPGLRSPEGVAALRAFTAEFVRLEVPNE